MSVFIIAEAGVNHNGMTAVSDYQATEKSESDFVFGQSKTTVAVAAASLAVVGAWLWNKRK